MNALIMCSVNAQSVHSGNGAHVVVRLNELEMDINSRFVEYYDDIMHHLRSVKGQFKPSPGTEYYQRFSLLESNLYSIRVLCVEFQIPDGTPLFVSGKELGWEGTGFCLNDGRFVTSKYVVKPWLFWNLDYFDDFCNNHTEKNKVFHDMMARLMYLECSGCKVISYYSAVSFSGDCILFTSDSFTTMMSDRSIGIFVDEDDFSIGIPFEYSGITDWAYIPNVGLKDKGFEYKTQQNGNMERGTYIDIIGFASHYGIDECYNRYNAKSPIFNHGSIQKNLDDGMIIATSNIVIELFGTKMYGSPVFSYVHHKWVVVGLISDNGFADHYRIIPIDSIYSKNE